MSTPAPEPKWRRLTVETAPCPSCERTWGSEQTLAAHLIDAHGLPAPVAARRAAEMFQAIAKARAQRRGQERTPVAMAENRNDESEEERPMADTKKLKRCTACGSVGHRSDNAVCPKRGDLSGQCGHCHHPKTDHSPSCPRRPGAKAGHKKRKPITRKTQKGKERPRSSEDPVATAIRARIEEYQGKIGQLEAALEVMER